MTTPPPGSHRCNHRSATGCSGVRLLTPPSAAGWESCLDRESLVIRAGSRSVTGFYRARNEDRCAVDAERGVFLVVDGVGGHGGGAEASEIVARVLPSWLSQTEKSAGRDGEIIELAVADAIEAARREMIEIARTDPNFGRMAATMALAVVVDGILYVTHVGDCRAYLLHCGRLQRLTTDQTYVQAAINAGVFTEETACNHVWCHVLTNAIGVTPLDEPIDVHELGFCPGDRLVLCSDGLTNVVADDEIQQLLALVGSPRAAANALVDLALEHNSHDNVTCVVVDLAETESPPG
ncbi:MAG: serine/threonine-protein phosphatase [Pirellulaceae bacterium]|nr:serine/threonine-protein phosphatase [Pirellulaceae bacterium]MDP6719052.1 serine/threonine-protein phosphatase [Pirellulaceae bacterium]